MPRFFLRRHAYPDVPDAEPRYYYQIIESVTHPLGGPVREVPLATIHDATDAKRVLDTLRRERKDGIKDGIRRYAHWLDGQQLVGTTGRTLDRALAEVDVEADRET